MASKTITVKARCGEIDEHRVIIMDVGMLVGAGYGDRIANEIFITDELLDELVKLRAEHSAQALTIED